MYIRRLELHEILCGILGTRNVYFQPPENLKINYPAIVYSLTDIHADHADNGVYSSRRRYRIIVIDPNPDSTVVDKMAALPKCGFNSCYTKDNLNYTVFTADY